MDLRHRWRLAQSAVRAWADDYAPSMGAALSYYALFSIAPLLLIVIGVAGYFFGEEAARGEIYGELATLIGPDGAHAVQGLVAAARKPQSGVLAMIIGTALLVAGASTVFGELQNALDRIWRAPAREKAKGWWTLLRTRVLSFGMILGIAFLLMVSLVLSAAIAALGRWWGLHLIDIAVSFGLTTLLFAMIYKIMPRVRIAWRDVWVGAAVTAALFALGKWAIGLYLGRSSPRAGARPLRSCPGFRRRRSRSCRRSPTARRALSPPSCRTRTRRASRRGRNTIGGVRAASPNSSSWSASSQPTSAA